MGGNEVAPFLSCLIQLRLLPEIELIKNLILYNMGKGNYDFHYVYKTTNLINGKFYIGRRSTNKHPNIDSYLGSGVHLKRSLLKNGRKNFKKEVLEICDDFETLCERELYWQRIEKAVELGYNLIESDTRGCVCATGKWPEEILKKMSESQKGNTPWNKGKKVKKITCHHCGKTGGNSNMTRYHFDNCPENPTNNKEEILNKRIDNNPTKGRKQITEACIYCGRIASNSTISRWHNDNCLENPANNKEQIKKQRRINNPRLGSGNKQVTCPHCQAIGGEAGIKRWHFENCLEKPNNDKNKCAKRRKLFILTATKKVVLQI